jgi:hypothetical protein
MVNDVEVLGAPLDGLGLSARQHRRRFAALAVLAMAAGSFVQAHLARDCVALTGRTPHQLRAVQVTASSKTVGPAER